MSVSEAYVLCVLISKEVVAFKAEFGRMRSENRIMTHTNKMFALVGEYKR